MIPDHDKQFILECDASDYAIEAVLRQQKGDFSHPVAYYSRKLAPEEANYHVFDKELLAIVQALKHWHRFLKGAKHPVIIHTDHKNLEYFKGSQILNQRQACWSMDLLLFDFEIHTFQAYQTQFLILLADT